MNSWGPSQPQLFYDSVKPQEFLKYTDNNFSDLSRSQESTAEKQRAVQIYTELGTYMQKYMFPRSRERNILATSLFLGNGEENAVIKNENKTKQKKKETVNNRLLGNSQ